MKRTVIATEDNSKTLLIEGTEVTYHSIHGALTEANHIFIKNGLVPLINKKEITIFEMGLGTGLNAILAYDFGKKNSIKINYVAVEKYPVTEIELKAFDIKTQLKEDLEDIFKAIHHCDWEKSNAISALFQIQKLRNDILNLDISKNTYNIIFFDAFGPKFQPNLWKPNLLKKLYDGLKKGGTLITYCAQGQFKRDLKSVGFEVENLQGPPGKREITRGIKR